MQTHIAGIESVRESPWRASGAALAEPAAKAFEVKALEAFGTVVLVSRDHEVYAEGGPADYCYRVVAGAVRTVKLLPDGRRQITEFYLPGDIFGLDGFAARYFAAEAVADATLIRYPRRRIEALAEEDPRFARRLRDMASDSLRKAHEQMLLLGRKSAQERIASFLVALAERPRKGAADGIELPMTRGDIADHLGLTLETVSRVLNRLHRDDVITLASTHHIEVHDLATLREMAGEV